MGDFDEAFIEALKVQSWSLYGVGMFFIALRMYARIRRLGYRNLQIDDYIMLLAGGLYTALVICLNVICGGGGSNLYPPEMTGTFTPVEVQERIYGSKVVVVSEQAMLNVIYAIKVCMLFMYTRLTLGLAAQRAVRYVAAYVAVGWLSTEVAFFTACRPFEGYWAMPPPDPQCTTLERYAIVQGCFNISSDLLMLCIPLPLVARMSMPWRQKIVLVFIFGLGLFVIAAALMTKIFNLTNVWDPSYMLWYVREASVAVYVSNLPMIWPLLREKVPWLRNLTPGGGVTGSTRKGTGAGGGTLSGGVSGKRSGMRSANNHSRPMGSARRRSSAASLDSTYDIEMALKGSSAGRGRRAVADDTSSTEHIVKAERSHEQLDRKPSSGGGIKVTVVRTVDVSEGRRWGDDVETGLFDWDHQRGKSENRIEVGAKA